MRDEHARNRERKKQQAQCQPFRDQDPDRKGHVKHRPRAVLSWNSQTRSLAHKTANLVQFTAFCLLFSISPTSLPDPKAEGSELNQSEEHTPELQSLAYPV